MSESNNLGNKSLSTILKYLREIGDDEAVAQLQAKGGVGQGLGIPWGTQVWGHSGFLCGYLPPEPDSKFSTIQNAFALPPDPSLKNTRIKITMERFWVHRYPGSGTHQILCEFTGKNQLQGEHEDLRFALTTEANDNASAAVSGSPIFLGVSVGSNGIAFEGKTINVKSKDDETILAALGSGPFREGLGLLTTVQPALKPFVGLASSVVTSVLKRSQNKQVYYFKLGLDFATSQTSVSLRHGSFIVVQADSEIWDWNQLAWSMDAQKVVRKDTHAGLEYNYMVFRVSEYVTDPEENSKPHKVAKPVPKSGQLDRVKTSVR